LASPVAYHPRGTVGWDSRERVAGEEAARMRPTLRNLARAFTLSALCLAGGGEAVGSAVGAAPAATWITYVDSSAGRIAVHVSEPEAPRYADGAPIVVNVSGFFTPRRGFVF